MQITGWYHGQLAAPDGFPSGVFKKNVFPLTLQALKRPTRLVFRASLSFSTTCTTNSYKATSWIISGFFCFIFSPWAEESFGVILLVFPCFWGRPAFFWSTPFWRPTAPSAGVRLLGEFVGSSERFVSTASPSRRKRENAMRSREIKKLSSYEIVYEWKKFW